MGVFLCLLLSACLVELTSLKLNHSSSSNRELTEFLMSHLSSLDSVAAKPEPINWDFYTKNISKPGMVEAFKKAVSR